MLAILTSHPIQYQAPLWKAIHGSGETPISVWFLTTQGIHKTKDADFGREFSWDIDLLDGYSHGFLKVNEDWDLRRFRGVQLKESLRDRLFEQRIEALWIEGWRLKPLWDAVTTAKRLGISVWMRGESNDLRRDAWWKGAPKRLLLGRHFRHVDEFLCIGSANRRLYRRYGVEEARLHSAPYCVDNDRFALQAAALRDQRSALRTRWNIPQNAYCILFCGKFIGKKRPMDLVLACQRLGAGRERSTPICLLLAGDGELAPQLRVSTQDAAHGDATSDADPRPLASFAGFLNQSEIAAAYVAADLLVLPSDSGETWGLVVNEAMACGLPVVASDQCGCAEDLVASLARELVFRCGDVDGLVRAIRFAMHSQFTLERVVAVADQHHLRHTVKTVNDLYRARRRR
jgi:glycosyltransferase involved in cell wall biosynthesis